MMGPLGWPCIRQSCAMCVLDSDDRITIPSVREALGQAIARRVRDYE